MNFLAHLYIAEQTATDFTGAIAADFVRGELSGWPEPYRTAMQLHRYVDKRVDQMAEVQTLKQLFQSQHRRVAGILLDLAFDHHLAKHWSEFHKEPLELFAEHCFRQIENSEGMPDSFLTMFERMRATNWLLQYRDRQLMSRAIERIALRLSRPELLVKAKGEIWRLEDQIESATFSVVPQLVSDAKDFLVDS